jgi:hypothetical protein
MQIGLADAGIVTSGAGVTCLALARLIRMSPTRRFDGRARALADAAMERYVEWREACSGVELLYRRWRDAAPADSSLAYTRYVAALDHEERAATAYAEVVRHAQRFSGAPVSA